MFVLSKGFYAFTMFEWAFPLLSGFMGHLFRVYSILEVFSVIFRAEAGIFRAETKDFGFSLKLGDSH